MIEVNYNDDSLSKYYDKFLFKFTICETFEEFIVVNNVWQENRHQKGSFHDFMYSLPMYQSNIEFSREDLERDYNTAFSALQQYQIWEDYKRNQDILPFLQFDCVMDESANELDYALNMKTIAINDPILNIIFPPNYYGDRTTTRRLRKANEILDFNSLPKIKKAFANNVGKAFVIDRKDFFIVPNTTKNINRVKRYYRKYQNDNKRCRWFK